MQSVPLQVGLKRISYPQYIDIRSRQVVFGGQSQSRVPDTMEFTKEGKAKVTLTLDGKRISLNGTYVIEGDKLTLRTKFADGEEVSEIATVTRLTDKELHFKDLKGRKTELKRKK